jgi:hypothetical protein
LDGHHKFRAYCEFKNIEPAWFSVVRNYEEDDLEDLDLDSLSYPSSEFGAYVFGMEPRFDEEKVESFFQHEDPDDNIASVRKAVTDVVNYAGKENLNRKAQ